jgi:hypothetical protein
MALSVDYEVFSQRKLLDDLWGEVERTDGRIALLESARQQAALRRVAAQHAMEQWLLEHPEATPAERAAQRKALGIPDLDQELEDFAALTISLPRYREAAHQKFLAARRKEVEAELVHSITEWNGIADRAVSTPMVEWPALLEEARTIVGVARRVAQFIDTPGMSCLAWTSPRLGGGRMPLGTMLPALVRSREPALSPSLLEFAQDILRTPHVIEGLRAGKLVAPTANGRKKR